MSKTHNGSGKGNPQAKGRNQNKPLTSEATRELKEQLDMHADDISMGDSADTQYDVDDVVDQFDPELEPTSKKAAAPKPAERVENPNQEKPQEQPKESPAPEEAPTAEPAAEPELPAAPAAPAEEAEPEMDFIDDIDDDIDDDVDMEPSDYQQEQDMLGRDDDMDPEQGVTDDADNVFSTVLPEVKQDEDFSTPLPVVPGQDDSVYTARREKEYGTSYDDDYEDGEDEEDDDEGSHGGRNLIIFTCIVLIMAMIAAGIGIAFRMREKSDDAQPDDTATVEPAPEDEQEPVYEEPVDEQVPEDQTPAEEIDTEAVIVDEQTDTQFNDPLPPLTVTTEEMPYSCIAQYLGQYIGYLESPAWGLSVQLCYSADGGILDALDSACVLTPEYGTPGIGDPTGASVIADRNNQEFKMLQYAKIGDRVTAETLYGQFIYEVETVDIGTMSADGTAITLMNGNDLMSYCASGAFNGIAMYTEYPFDGTGDGSQYYVVLAKLVDGTKLVK